MLSARATRKGRSATTPLSFPTPFRPKRLVSGLASEVPTLRSRTPTASTTARPTSPTTVRPLSCLAGTPVDSGIGAAPHPPQDHARALYPAAHLRRREPRRPSPNAPAPTKDLPSSPRLARHFESNRSREKKPWHRKNSSWLLFKCG